MNDDTYYDYQRVDAGPGYPDMCVNDSSCPSKNHKVECTLTVSANDYSSLKQILPPKYFDQLETKREIAIMKDVLAMPGYSISEKADNAIEAWSHEKQRTVRGNVRYKLKYRY